MRSMSLKSGLNRVSGIIIAFVVSYCICIFFSMQSIYLLSYPYYARACVYA